MENKIIAYRVVRADGDVGLEREIRNAISTGWQPLGGAMNWGHWFYQVVVKYEEAEKWKEEYCGSCRWFRYKEPTGGWCCAIPSKVERNAYEPGCSLYAHRPTEE